MKKIVNVRKFIISSTILFFLIVMSVSTVVNITYSHNNTKYKTLYVTQGDTLWSIALKEKENSKYYKNTDVRDIIYDIKSINNLNESNLTVGQELRIPIGEESI